MKKWYLIIFAILLSSCGLLKDVSKNKVNEKIKILETTREWTRRPGDVIFVPAPRTPSERFKDTIIVYKGQKGATATTSFDRDGFVSGQVINCPDSEETKQTDIKAEYSLKEKQVDKTANIEFANVIGKWTFYSFCVISFFGCIAILGRALILKR